MWQTTATALRADGEAMLVDAPYFPDELEALPDVLGQAGFEPDALVATHGDFDHLLGRLAYPRLALGVAESTMLRVRAEPGAAQRELRRQDDELYVARPQPLALGALQALPVPGKLELGRTELELHPAEGHTEDGMTLFSAASGVLCCGDYLSDVELPTISPGGSLRDYRGTLGRLERLLSRAMVVVPGHGSPQERDRARRTLEEDLAYLEALERGEERPPLPSGRDTARQREIHAANLREVG
jgi:glyoxylase-like metal-dependent hydrolase (beta-lactamase superfamily II)